MDSRFSGVSFVAGVLALSSPTVLGQSTFDKLASAISAGSTTISMRYRLEDVEQDNALKDATASTLRTRLTWNSGQADGFSALLEIDNVTTLGADHYDSFVTNKYRGAYSIIADPVGTEMNQALLRYKPDATNTFTLGMQRILHAGQRFIGGVGWRQNEQTFDALTWQRRDATWDFDYSFVWNVNRIFGTSKSSVQRSNLDSNSHIALGTYKADFGNLSFYTYALDFADAPALSNLTYGLSFEKQIGDLGFNTSFARQSDYGDNSISYQAHRFTADVTYKFTAANLKFGYELLGSDDGVVAFSTPLATLHIWQGWADMFLNTPAAGIEDSYVTVSGKFGEAAWSATYHDFDSDEGSVSYGGEWDLVASYPLHPRLTAELKYSSYASDSFAVDTDKLWLSLNFAF